MELGFLIPVMGIIMGVSIPITAIKLKHRERIEQMRLAAAHSGSRDSGQDTRQAARIVHDREIDNEPLRELDRLLAEKKGSKR